MTAATPPALLGFFRQEAREYLDRLRQLLDDADTAGPEPAAFLANARALRGSATMTRLDGLAELPSTLERIAGGLRSGELRWDQRLGFAVHGALVEYAALVDRVEGWSDGEQRHARTRAVALAAVAAGYLAQVAAPPSPGGPVVPIARFFPDDGRPAVVHRAPSPPVTLAERFRGDIAAAADGVAREAAALATGARGAQQLALTDGVRRALLGLADVAESYGAQSIAALATAMARAPLTRPADVVAVQAYARQLMDRECTDAMLATKVKEHAAAWRAAGGGVAPAPAAAALPAPAAIAPGAPGGGRPTPTATTSPSAPAAAPVPVSSATAPPGASTPVVPVESLLFRGPAALAEARRVQARLRQRLAESVPPLDAETRALLDELGDLLDLAGR